MSPSLELLQQLALLASSLASAGWIGRHWHRADEADRPLLFCGLLAFLLAAGMAGSGALHLGLGLALGAAKGWLAQAAYQLGLPLLALASVALARGWRWQKSSWGRLVIGLCVFFELARRFGWSQPYAAGLGVASALLVGYAGMLARRATRLLGLALGAAVLLLIAAPLSGNPLLAWRSLALAAAIPLLAALLSALQHDADQRTASAADGK